MGPISRLSARQTDPYQARRERLEKKAAEKEDGSVKETKNTPMRRARDEYVPGDDRTLETDKTPEKSKGSDKASKQAEGKKPQMCKASTDKVDREIEKLKKRKKELEGQLRTEQDETRRQSLESELAQVERELSQKDNDSYRRQHTVFTKM